MVCCDVNSPFSLAQRLDQGAGWWKLLLFSARNVHKILCIRGTHSVIHFCWRGSTFFVVVSAPVVIGTTTLAVGCLSLAVVNGLAAWYWPIIAASLLFLRKFPEYFDANNKKFDINVPLTCLQGPAH